MDAYATHLHATVSSALQSGLLWPGSLILELGCGDYSTPVLAAIAEAQNRPYRCLSSDKDWLSRYAVPSDVVEDWESQPFFECGFALLDSEELVVNRVRRLEPLAQLAKVIVMHDAREDLDWSWIARHLKYRVICADHRPWTLVASNYVDPAKWLAHQGPPSATLETS